MSAMSRLFKVKWNVFSNTIQLPLPQYIFVTMPVRIRELKWNIYFQTVQLPPFFPEVQISYLIVNLN